MTTYHQFPRISTVFDASSDHPSNLLYSSSIRNALRRILSHEMLFNDMQEGGFDEEYVHRFLRTLPIIKWSEWGASPQTNVSIFLLCRYRPNVSKFFYDIISRWLVPGKRFHIGLFFSTDFKIFDFEESLFTISEIVLCLEGEMELEMVRRNLPMIEPEIRLGVASVYHASRIMEIKGLSADEKTTLIQEKIATLIQRRPQDFDYDIFSQMQHFLVMCREEFKAVREYRHMSRMISVFYLFRKVLRQQVETFSNKRHLSLKLVKARLHLPLGVKQVLAIFVGLNFLKENEVFEERHLFRALQHYVPDAQIIEDSFFIDENREDKIQTIYLEIEKADNAHFSLEEIQRLRKSLPEDLKNRVEQLMRPIFMPRNEEEVMRNIVTLSHQLKYIRDLPQVIISFDEQTDTDLFFTVILVRVLMADTLSIQELFMRGEGTLQFIPDRIKEVGMLRNKYTKEATVFRVQLPNEAFVREDHSVDLYKARQEVIAQLQKTIGEIRDFNGGMLAKQLEVFLSMKDLLGEVGRQHEFLLENFFHSLFPVALRSVLDPDILKKLFIMLLTLIQEERVRHAFHFKKEGERLFVMISVQELSAKQKVYKAIEHLHLLSSQLVWLHLQLFETLYLGYIYFCDEEEKQDLFLKTLQQTLDF
jgi:hypothetical protein